MNLIRRLILVLTVCACAPAFAQTNTAPAAARSTHTPAQLTAADRVIDAMALAQV